MTDDDKKFIGRFLRDDWAQGYTLGESYEDYTKRIRELAMENENKSKQWKVGDRVRVFATLNGVVVETSGWIMIIEEKRFLVRLDNKHDIWAHPKQCRKLIKKKKKKEWTRNARMIQTLNDGTYMFIALSVDDFQWTKPVYIELTPMVRKRLGLE